MSEHTALSEPRSEPLPLLAQAEARLASTRETEHRLRREVELPGSGVTWDHVSAAQHETRQAQGWVDQVQRSCDALPGALEEARRTLYMAESALTQVETQARQMLTQARRQVEQAREQVAKLERDWRTIAGTEAGPV